MEKALSSTEANIISETIAEKNAKVYLFIWAWLFKASLA